jgi:L-ascorbate metabolism protein UlaG (beta-lactamase superfamily)
MPRVPSTMHGTQDRRNRRQSADTRRRFEAIPPARPDSDADVYEDVHTDTTESPAQRGPNGSFRNPWPDSEPKDWRDVLKWTRERRTQTRAKTPLRGSFPVSTPAIKYPRASDADFAATWIGHSTVLLQFGGTNVLTDPVFSQRAFPVQWLGPRRVMDPAQPIDALPPLDVVLLSHNHYDHLDKPAVKRLASAHPETTWIVPLGLGSYIRGWGARAIVELDWWQRTEINGLRVTATPARHFSARRPGDRNKSLWCGFAFEMEGKRAYFAGSGSRASVKRGVWHDGRFCGTALSLTRSPPQGGFPPRDARPANTPAPRSRAERASRQRA